MANRSYLYSVDFIPESNLDRSGKKIIGISEWNYDIPIIYKVLLAGQPQVCNSLIWDDPPGIALVGNYNQGLIKLRQFFSKITLTASTEAQALIDETLAFLERHEHKNKYFLLECAEIFDMDTAPIPAQNLLLLDEIKNIDVQIEIALHSLLPAKAEPPRLGFFEKIFSKKMLPKKAPEDHQPQPQALAAFGFGQWTNTLYYHLNNDA